MSFQRIYGPLEMSPDSRTQIQQKLNAMFSELTGAVSSVGAAPEIKLTVSSSDGVVDSETVTRNKMNSIMFRLSISASQYGLPHVPAAVFSWTSLLDQQSLVLLNYFFSSFYAGSLMQGGTVAPPPQSVGWNDNSSWDDTLYWSDAA